jgi:hypothetical protein
MALSLYLSVSQGLSFTPGSTHGVGHLLSATICGAALAADITVTDPKTGSSSPAAGVLEEVGWQEGVADPILMTAFISAHNQSVLQRLQQSAIPTTAVTVSFQTREYDQVARSWYSAFAPAQPPLSGLIQEMGKSPQLTVASSATVFGSTQLYKVYFGMVPPANKAQSLRVANSSTSPVLKSWGLAVGQPGSWMLT